MPGDASHFTKTADTLRESMLAAEFAALLQVLLIDIVLAGDNAVVVGMAAAGVSKEIRARVIFWGIACAVVLRIGLALVAVQLLAIVGLTLAGGLLLLWVCWRMFRDIRQHQIGGNPDAINDQARGKKDRSFGRAISHIVIADLSMSLDNVLAVAGAARGHIIVLVIGLLISVALMGAAANLIAGLLGRYPIIAWLGLAVIVFVAVEMIWQGSTQVACAGIFPKFCDLAT